MSKEGNLYDALIWRLGQMVKENVELEQRVHQLVGDYNRVAKQLHGFEKRGGEADSAKTTLGEMMQMRDLCDKLEKENARLKEENATAQQALDMATERADTLAARCNRYIKAEFVEVGALCPHKTSVPGCEGVRVGSGNCGACRFCAKAAVSGEKCVLCTFSYETH